jgi:hypothetical protein
MLIFKLLSFIQSIKKKRQNLNFKEKIIYIPNGALWLAMTVGLVVLLSACCGVSTHDLLNIAQN